MASASRNQQQEGGSQPPITFNEQPQEPRVIGPGSVVGFCLTTQEVIPGVVQRVLPGQEPPFVGLKVKRFIPDRLWDEQDIRLKGPEIKLSEIEELHPRVRHADPLVDSRTGVPRHTLQFQYSTDFRGDGAKSGLNAPWIAGTWFDVGLFMVGMKAVRYEQKNQATQAVRVPYGERDFGIVDGLEYAKLYSEFARQRQDERWDLIVVTFQIKE